MTAPRLAQPGVSGHAAVDRAAPWLLLGLTIVFYAPIVAARATFPPGDFLHHFFPFSLFQHAAWQAGELPVWNPYTYGGHPFLADVQAAVYYPISNLLLLLTLPVTDPGWRLYLLHWDAVLHTWLGGLFLYWLARDLTGDAWAGLVGGAAFALSGYLTGYAPLQLAVLRTAIWLPLLWWSLARAWTGPQHWRWWLIAASSLAAAILAGHSQTLLLILYATAGWIVLLALIVRPPGAKGRTARLLGLFAVVAVSLGLTTAQWWPSWEFARYSVRAAADYAFVAGGFPWRDLWQLLLPGVLTQYSPLYIGVSGLLLVLEALFAAAAYPRRVESAATLPGARIPWRASVVFLALLTLAALVVSTGGNGPLYPLLYRLAPGWGLFRGQERAAYLATVGMCLLAGYGAALVPRLPANVRRRGALIAGALIVMLVYAFGLLWQLPGRTAMSHAGYLVIAATTLAFAVGGFVLVFAPGWGPRRSATLAAIIALNLIWTNVGTNLTWGTPWERVQPAPEIAAVQVAVTARADAGELPGRVFNEYRVYDDYGMAAGVEDVWGSSPLRLSAYAALFDEFPLDRMWRLLGVRYVLTWRRELFGPSELLGEWPQTTDTTYLHRLPQPNPRAWVATTVVVADEAETLTGLADHAISLNEVAWVPPGAGIGAVSLPPTDAIVQITRVAQRSLALTVESAGGLLVVAENWLPGWHVVDALCAGAVCPSDDADGRSYLTPIRADHALIGLWLPPGRVEFRLEYAPDSVFLGLWISLATGTLALAAIAWRLMARQSSRR
jgi:hypothetical protein